MGSRINLEAYVRDSSRVSCFWLAGLGQQNPNTLVHDAPSQALSSDTLPLILDFQT